MSQVQDLNKLPFDFLKLHQMQIIKGTKLEKEYSVAPQDFINFTVDQYISLLIEYLEKLKPDIIVERFISESPREKLIAPRWGLKNYEFVAKLEKEMNRRQAYQGRLYVC